MQQSLWRDSGRNMRCILIARRGCLGRHAKLTIFIRQIKASASLYKNAFGVLGSGTKSLRADTGLDLQSQQITSAAALLSFLITGLAPPAKAESHRAICSYYTRYEPCTVVISPELLEANLPTDFLSINQANYVDTKIYDDTGRGSNHVIGAATTILFGPIGLLGFLATKKSGTVDFGIEFRDEKGKQRTAFIRFVNMKAADSFGNDFRSFLRTVDPGLTGNKDNPASGTKRTGI